MSGAGPHKVDFMCVYDQYQSTMKTHKDPVVDWPFGLEIGKYTHGNLCPAFLYPRQLLSVVWILDNYWLKQACAHKWQSKVGRKAPLPQPYVAQVRVAYTSV